MTVERKLVKQVLIAVSLGNLCLLRVWAELTGYTPSEAFFLHDAPTLGQFYGSIAALAILSALFFGLIRVSSGTGSRTLKTASTVVLCAAVLLPLNAIRAAISPNIPVLRGGLSYVRPAAIVCCLVLAGLLAAALMYHFRTRLLGSASMLLIAISPLAAINVARVLWSASNRDNRPYAAGELAAMLPSQPPRRAVWVIFDEMDYRLAFQDRAPWLRMPTFDQLRAESLFATDARSPNNVTSESLPSLLSGRQVISDRPVSPAELAVRYANTTTAVRWTSGATIFSDVHRLGLNAAIIGWYLPYCRTMSGDVASCRWLEMGTQLTSLAPDFPNATVDEIRSLVETNTLSPFGASLAVKKKVRNLQQLVKYAKEAVADPKLGLVFVHLPATHAPHVYDAARGTLTRTNSPVRGYRDSLALADEMLGELRKAIENAGLWDRTTLLVSSDHHYRVSQMVDGKSDARVPFLLHLGGSSTGVSYDRRLLTIRSRPLLMAILRGEISRMADVTSWLDRHQQPEDMRITAVSSAQGRPPGNSVNTPSRQ